MNEKIHSAINIYGFVAKVGLKGELITLNCKEKKLVKLKSIDVEN